MNEKLLLISYRLGYNNLLYWDQILSAIKSRFDNFVVFTAWPTLITNNKSVSTQGVIKGIKFYRNKFRVNQKLLFIPFPGFLSSVIKYRPSIIILNEFNLACFYIVLFKRLINKNAKLIILVESDPYLGQDNYKRKDWIRSLYRKHMINKSNLVLTNNVIGRNYLLKYLNADPLKVKSCPYLTSNPPSSEIKNQTYFKTARFITVGQLTERKGQEYLIKAVSLLPEHLKNNMSLRIVGDGPLRSELEALAAKQKLRNIEFVGSINYSDIWKHYSISDCLVSSTLRDYRSLVGFEALSFGLAIITSQYDGARYEIVKEGENGFIIDPYNLEMLAEKLRLIISDRHLLGGFKQVSRTMAQSYNEKVCINNLLTTIDEVRE